MIQTSTYAVIDQTTKMIDYVKAELVPVERKPSETKAYFIPSGKYKVMTSNGESFCEGPVWILWDSVGYPYPVTPSEFEKLYTRLDSSSS